MHTGTCMHDSVHVHVHVPELELSCPWYRHQYWIEDLSENLHTGEYRNALCIHNKHTVMWITMC